MGITNRAGGGLAGAQTHQWALLLLLLVIGDRSQRSLERKDLSTCLLVSSRLSRNVRPVLPRAISRPAARLHRGDPRYLRRARGRGGRGYCQVSPWLPGGRRRADGVRG